MNPTITPAYHLETTQYREREPEQSLDLMLRRHKRLGKPRWKEFMGQSIEEEGATQRTLQT